MRSHGNFEGRLARLERAAQASQPSRFIWMGSGESDTHPRIANMIADGKARANDTFVFIRDRGAVEPASPDGPQILTLITGVPRDEPEAFHARA